jgi:hypothetical protein
MADVRLTGYYSRMSIQFAVVLAAVALMGVGQGVRALRAHKKGKNPFIWDQHGHD